MEAKETKIDKKIVFSILIFLIMLIAFIFEENIVQATERIGNSYLLEDGYITRIMPETKVNDFKTNLLLEETIEVIDEEGNKLEDDSIVGTGMSCNIGDKTYKLSALGDLSGDGKISITDLVKMNLHIVKINLLGNDFEKSADINGDKKTTLTDLVLLNLIQTKIKDIKEYALESANPSNPSDEKSIYVKLYDDGTLAFTTTDKLIDGKNLVKSYGNVYNQEYKEVYNVKIYAPWYEDRKDIITVDIAEIIEPKSTAYWFNGLNDLVRIDNISNLNTSNVTNMRCMFNGCWDLTSLDLSNFDTSRVTDMNGMFCACNGLTSLNLSKFDTSRVTDMSGMFSNCNNITSLDLSNFNTSNVTDMEGMFMWCTGLTSLNLNNFDTSNVLYMQTMFFQCEKLINLNLSSFNTSKVTNMESMFHGCQKLESLNLSNFDTSNVIRMESMFCDCLDLSNINLSNFNTEKVQTMKRMFMHCENLTTIDLSSFNTIGDLGDISCMFASCTKLTTIYGGDNWDIYHLEQNGNATDMFENCGTDHVTIKTNVLKSFFRNLKSQIY